MLVRDILDAKGHEVLTISPEASLSEAISRMVECGCGSLLVEEDDRMVGIISERDILRTYAATDVPLEEVRVRSRMTDNIITGAPADDLNQVMGVMTENRIRHLPILDEGQLVGLISIGDVVKAQHAHLAMENHYLMNYIQS